MRKLLSGRWRGLPVGIIAALLALVLISGGVLASYAVVSGTVTVEVKEAFTVEYSLDSTDGSDGNWVAVTSPDFPIAITDAYPGDCYSPVWVKITNASGNPLLGKVSVVPVSSGWLNLTMTSALFSTGLVVPGGGSIARSFSACIADDAPPNTYTVNVSVLRG